MSEKDLQKEITDLKSELRRLKKDRKYGLIWEEKPEDVVIDGQKNIPVLRQIKNLKVKKSDNEIYNLLIEGDNYHTLSALVYTHKKKVDVIYIDPPYNTGAKNWRYNNDYVDKEDEYRHSKWLSFMSHRLKLARELLNQDGILICAIDHNEQETLGLLLEDIFPTYEKVCVTIIHNPGGIQGDNFSYTHEYAYFIFPKGKEYISRVEREDVKPTPLRDWGGDESKRNTARNCFYPIIVDPKTKKIIGFGDVLQDEIHPKSANEKRKDGNVEIYPIDGNGVERKWRFARQTVEDIWGELKCEENKGELVINRYKSQYRYKTVWVDSKYNSNTYGSNLVNQIIDTKFPFPKSLYNTKECLIATTKNRRNALVVDFFAGSGTTGHAVLEMNKEDGGNRRFILCTNNENNICKEVTYERVKRVMSGYKNLKTGEKVEGLGGNLAYYKTDIVEIEHLQKIPDEAKIRVTYQAGEMIAVREDTLNEVEKNEWWQIFEGHGRMTAIYFKEDKSKLAELIEKLEKKGLPVALYIFSWGKNEYKGEYSSAHIRVEDIPEPILEVYKEINRL